MNITKASDTQIFLWFALQECARALEHYEASRTHAAVRRQISPGVEQRELGLVFDALRLALHYTASVSRIFWTPSNRPNSKARSEKLREVIDLASDHPLQSRKWRDHFEHLDERLDKWVERSPREFTAVEMVLYADADEIVRNVAESSVAVVYDEKSCGFLLFGDQFPLIQLEAGVTEIRELISAYLGQPKRADTFVV